MNTTLKNTEKSQVELYQLPEGWVITHLGNIIEISKEKVDPKICSESVYIGLENIERDTGELISIGNSKSVKSTKARFQPGEILYGRLRPYLNKIWLANCEGICSTDILVFLKNDYIDNKFIFYRFLSKDFVNYSTLNSKGVELPRVNYQTISKFAIPLPPLPEQYRIVEKIEEEFTRLNAGVSALKKAKALIPKYRQSVLKAAMCGDLTKEWRAEHPDVESAEVLVERIKSEITVESKSKIKFDQEFEDLITIPNTWQYIKIGNIALVDTGTTPARKNNNYWKNGTIPWATSGLLNEDYIYNTEEFVTEFALKETRLKIFPKGTLLIALYGEGKTRGKCSELMIESTINQACASLQFINSGENVKGFVKWFLIKNYYDIRKISSGGVQPNLNLTKIKSISLPLPPLPEQHEIVCEIERRFSVIDQMEKAVDDSLVKAERLRQSILKKAFEGRLVPQNPDDEPASVLLERIQAEKEQRAAEEKARKKDLRELKKQKKEKKEKREKRELAAKKT